MDLRPWTALLIISALLLTYGSSAEQPERDYDALAETLKALVPTDAIKQATVEMKEKMTTFLQDLVKPTNIKIFIKLIKESKIHNKGEIIRLSMTLPTAHNHPERTIDSFKRLDKKTIQEMAVIFSNYMQIIIPSVLGEKYKHVNKYVDEQDVRAFSGLMYEVLEHTPTQDLVWALKTLEKENVEVKKNAEILMEGDPNVLIKALEENSDDEYKEKVTNTVENIQKFNELEHFSPYMPAFLEAIKKTLNHILEQFWDDIEEKVGSVDPQSAVTAINLITKKISIFTKKAGDYVDLDDLGDDVGKFLTRLQGLNTTQLVEEAKKLKTYLPPVESVLEDIDNSKDGFIGGNEKEQLKKAVKYLDEAKFPKAVENMLAEIVLMQLQKVDVKQVQGAVEFFTKNSKLNSEVYDVIKSTAINIIKHKLKALSSSNRTSSSFHDIIINMENAITKVDDARVSKLLKKVVNEIDSLSPALIADVASDSNTVLKDIIHHHLLLKLIYDPALFIKSMNKTVLYDVISVVVDSVKMLNEDVIFDTCFKRASFNKEDMEKELEKLFKKIETEILAVKNGKDTLKKIQYDDISKFFTKFLPTLNIKNLCIDIKGIIKLCKMLESQEKEEITGLIWNLKTKRFTTENRVENERDIIDVFDAIYNVILKRNGGDKEDFRLKAVKQAKEFFKKKFSANNSQSQET